MRDHRTLRVWQEANRLARFGVRLSREAWRPYATAAFSQLQRATLSVQLNIAEGYARYTPGQIHQGLTVAYGSAVESAEVLELLRVEGIIDEQQGREGIALAEGCQKMLLGLLRRYRKPIR